MARPRVVIAIVSVLVAYAAAVLSPLPKAIGRRSPELAAALSPPLFNFLESYQSGNVLEFRVGMKRPDLIATIKQQYGSVGELIPICGSGEAGRRGGGIRPSSPEAVELLSRNIICMDLTERRVVLIFFLVNDTLERIDLGRVTWGL